MFKSIISQFTTRSARLRESQQETKQQSCTMESMESRLMMASDYLYSGGLEPTTTGTPVTFTYTVTNPAPTTGILIGLLLPAVQKVRA